MENANFLGLFVEEKILGADFLSGGDPMKIMLRLIEGPRALTNPPIIIVEN